MSPPIESAGAGRFRKVPCPAFRPGGLGLAFRCPLENGAACRLLARSSSSKPSIFFFSLSFSACRRLFSCYTSSTRSGWLSGRGGLGLLIHCTITEPLLFVQRI